MSGFCIIHNARLSSQKPIERVDESYKSTCSEKIIRSLFFCSDNDLVPIFSGEIMLKLWDTHIFREIIKTISSSGCLTPCFVVGPEYLKRQGSFKPNTTIELLYDLGYALVAKPGHESELPGGIVVTNNETGTDFSISDASGCPALPRSEHLPSLIRFSSGEKDIPSKIAFYKNELWSEHVVDESAAPINDVFLDKSSSDKEFQSLVSSEMVNRLKSEIDSSNQEGSSGDKKSYSDLINSACDELSVSQESREIIFSLYDESL